jgi:hypothetical protein
MSEDSRRFLLQYFREPTQRLYGLLGRDFGWQQAP